MKVFLVLFAIFLACELSAQKAIFVRVYNKSGAKIARGRVLSVTDSSLQLQKGTSSILVRNIGSIRTRHSAGNNVLVGSIIGSTTAAIAGAASGGPDEYFNSGEGAAAAAIVGLPVGAIIGAVTIPFKNSKRYLIDGDLEKWKVFKSSIPVPKTEETKLTPQ